MFPMLRYIWDYTLAYKARWNWMYRVKAVGGNWPTVELADRQIGRRQLADRHYWSTRQNQILIQKYFKNIFVGQFCRSIDCRPIVFVYQFCRPIARLPIWLSTNCHPTSDLTQWDDPKCARIFCGLCRFSRAPSKFEICAKHVTDCDL